MSKTMEKSAETGYFHAYGNRGIILVSADFKEERGLIFMYVKLSIPERLKDLRVVDKHLTLEQLANETGLSRSALAKYEGDGYKDISPFAIATLADFYGVSADYLMGLTENKEIPNIEVQSLHLNDSMIELLKSGRINNRLLCEIATHEDFPRLLTDITIIVDRIAGMRVNQLNMDLEAARQTVMETYAPGEDDLYMRTLEVHRWTVTIISTTSSTKTLTGL